MQLIKRTCSNCHSWSSQKYLKDDILAADCLKQLVTDVALGLVHKITKGSDTCGQYNAKKAST